MNKIIITALVLLTSFGIVSCSDAEWFVIDGGGDCYVYSYKPQIKDGYDYWLYSDEDVSHRSECIGSVNHVKDCKKL